MNYLRTWGWWWRALLFCAGVFGLAAQLPDTYLRFASYEPDYTLMLRVEGTAIIYKHREPAGRDPDRGRHPQARMGRYGFDVRTTPWNAPKGSIAGSTTVIIPTWPFSLGATVPLLVQYRRRYRLWRATRGRGFQVIGADEPTGTKSKIQWPDG